MKKSCVIYDSWADQILNLPSDMAGEYAKAILRYAIYGEDTETDNPVIKAILVPVKKKIDDDNRKYQEKVDRMKANSRNRNDIDTISERYQNEVDSDTVTDTVTDKYKKKNNKKKSGTAYQKIHNFTERDYDFGELETITDIKHDSG